MVAMKDPAYGVVVNDAGTVLTKSALTTLLGSAVNADPVYQVPAGTRLRERSRLDGENDNTPDAYRLLGAPGQLIRQSEIDAMYPAAAVTSISPATGAAAGGTAVTVNGSNFKFGATVSIGGVAATSVFVVDSTKITCVTGAHAAGAVSAVVTTSAGASPALASAYTYV